MRTLTVSVIGAAIAAAMQGVAAASGPPELDVHPSCRAADRVSFAAGADKPRSDMQACLDDEHTARGALLKRWAGFSPVARTQCVGMNRTGGPPSYVELLTCLEVMRDAAEGRVNQRVSSWDRGAARPPFPRANNQRAAGTRAVPE
jgi:hypothetical protein